MALINGRYGKCLSNKTICTAANGKWHGTSWSQGSRTNGEPVWRRETFHLVNIYLTVDSSYRCINKLRDQPPSLVKSPPRPFPQGLLVNFPLQSFLRGLPQLCQKNHHHYRMLMLMQILEPPSTSMVLMLRKKPSKSTVRNTPTCVAIVAGLVIGKASVPPTPKMLGRMKIVEPTIHLLSPQRWDKLRKIYIQVNIYQLNSRSLGGDQKDRSSPGESG